MYSVSSCLSIGGKLLELYTSTMKNNLKHKAPDPTTDMKKYHDDHSYKSIRRFKKEFY